MNSFKILCKILRDYYESLTKIERIFLNTFIAYISGYVILFVGYLISTGNFSYNFVTIPLTFFPIISLIITFNSRTILHGLAFLCVQCFPIIVGVSFFYTQYNACSEPEGKDFCYSSTSTSRYRNIVAGLLLFFLILFAVFYCLFLFYLWKERTWLMIHEFKVSENSEDINEMCSMYQMQFPILHSKLMIIGLWITLYTSLVWGLGIVSLGRGEGLVRQNYVNYAIPLDYLILTYSIFMLKGVRDESKFIMYIVYFGNFSQVIILYSITIGYCRSTLNDNGLSELSLINGGSLYCFRYDMFFDIFIIMTTLSCIILILSTWNTVRCHRNFGKEVGFYIKYEPIPDEYKYRNLVKRGSGLTNVIYV